jgi:hypothetical protein
VFLGHNYDRVYRISLFTLDPNQKMNMLFLPNGGTASTTYTVSAAPGLVGQYLLLQFIDYTGKYPELPASGEHR